MIRITTLVLLPMLFAGGARAQEIRASISGTVTDPSGAAVPQAVVTAANLDTNITTTVKSAGNGDFIVPQLPAGPYELRVEAAGFQKHVRSGITLNVGDKTSIQVRLEVGSTNESVTVNAELTGIEQNQSILGQLMDTKKVSELPLNGRQVFMLLPLSAGVLFTTPNPTGTRAWDAGGPFVIQGSFQSTNSFVLDGAPLGVNGQWDYSPLVDAVAEFKVTAFTNDASQGLTGGGVINMTMKSGTNELHGLASEFIRNNIFDANTTQTNRAAAQSPYLKTQQHQWNSFAAMLTGPIIKNKFFYAGHYEGFRERVPFPLTESLPTLDQRGGNFSRTFNDSGALVSIFDPLTTRASGANFVRDAFPGNVIPANRMPAVARNILGYIPLPNIVTNPLTNVNNFASSPNLGRYQYDSFYIKSDYLWNARHRTTASHTQNHGTEYRTQNGFPEGDPARYGPDPNNRAHYGAILDHVWTATPSLVLEGRVSWDRYYWLRALDSIDAFDGSKLGFTGPSGANAVTHFPSITMTNYANIGAGVDRMFAPNDAYTAVVDASKSLSRHFLKFGTRFGQARFNRQSQGNIDGLFAFTPAFTQRDPQRADTTSGNAVASFLLGYPNSGSTDLNAAASDENKFFGLYLQDDFKVNSRLVLNLGLRWDLQTPTTERFNRITTAFDPTIAYTLAGAPAQGGITFASNSNRQAFAAHYRDFQPRVGAAYCFTPKMVFRAGYGLSFLPLNGNNSGAPPDVYQTGYSRSTPYIATIGGGVNSFIPGLPGTGTLQSPFTQGILQPFGTALGPKTQLGQSLTSLDPGFEIPRVHQFNAGIEYELPAKITLETSYVGSRTHDFTVSRQIDAITLAQRLQGFADPNYLNASVPNPFSGAPELAGTALGAPTITRGQALKPYPQFSGVVLAGRPLGGSSFNALEVRLNKRLSKGLTVVSAFTWSKTIQWTAFREDQYASPERVLSNLGRSRHLTVDVLYDLPFGRGKWVGQSWGRLVNAAIGNWQYNIMVETMTGTPTAMPDATPIRDPQLPNGGQSFDQWFNTCTLLTNGQRSHCSSPDEPVTWVQLKPNELRTYSSRFPNITDPWRPQVNMSLFKLFPIHERVKLEFRAESFNAFNTPIYAGPDTGITSSNFGVVTRDQQNFARNMQFALRLRF